MATAFAAAVIIVVSACATVLGWLSLRSVSYVTAPIEEAVRRHGQSLLGIPGVLSVGIDESEGSPCVVVLISGLAERESPRIPRALDGWEVRRQTADDERGFRGRRGFGGKGIAVSTHSTRWVDLS